MGHKYVVHASLFINNLIEALFWMIWQDVSQKKPFKFCAECQRLIKQKTAHERKFCPGRCGGRKTDREAKEEHAPTKARTTKKGKEARI